MIEQVTIIVFQIVGIYAAFRDGAPLGWVRQNLESKLHHDYLFILNPLFNCITCMGGIWGVSLAMIEFGCSPLTSLYTSASCIGLGYVISSLIQSND